MPQQPHDSWAYIYDQAYEKVFGAMYHELTSATLNFIEKNIQKKSRILDLGAGTGRLSIPLAEAEHNVTAVDPSLEMLKVLKKKDTTNSIRTLHSKVQDLEVGEKYEVALCVFSVFCYLIEDEELKRAISKMVVSTAKCGWALIDVPCLTAFRGFNYNEQGLERYVRVVEMDPKRKIFKYIEDISFNEHDRSKRVQDEFPIRYWDPEFILRVFLESGMKLREDVTNIFPGSGAHYFVLERH